MTYEVIDADGHVTETWEQIARHLEEPYRRRPLLTSFFPQDGWDRRLLGTKGDWAGDASSWEKALDSGGMSVSVLYPTLGLNLQFVRDPEWAVVLARAYNTMLFKELTGQSKRLKAVALLPLQDPEAAAQRVATRVRRARCGSEECSPPTARCWATSASIRSTRSPNVSAFPLGVHAAGSDAGFGGAEPFPKFIQAHTCSHALAQMRQITSMMFDGIPVRFPELKLAFLEAGAGWVPYFLQRMDEEWEKRGHVEATILTRSPTEYVRAGPIYFSCEADEPLLPQAAQWVGDDRIFYASDYPHWDHSYPRSVHELGERTDLTEAQKRLVLADNARRFYGLQR